MRRMKWPDELLRQIHPISGYAEIWKAACAEAAASGCELTSREAKIAMLRRLIPYRAVPRYGKDRRICDMHGNEHRQQA